MDTETPTKTTPLLSRRDKANRICTVAWKLSHRLEEALREIQSKKASDIRDIKDHFKELFNLILDIQIIKEKEVLALIKQRPPGSLPPSPERHVEEIIRIKSGSGSKSKPRVKVAWGNEQGTSGFDGLIGELDYDNYGSQYQEENIIHRKKEPDLEDRLQKCHFSSKKKVVKGIKAGKKCNFCEKSQQHAKRYQAERDETLFDIETQSKEMERQREYNERQAEYIQRQAELIEKLEVEKENLSEELKSSSFNVKYLEKKNEKTNRAMKDLEIMYNKKLTAAENTIEDLKQNFENSELYILQMENHSLRETINNLNETIEEINKSSQEKLKDALEASDLYEKESQRYKKARVEDKSKHSNVQRELSRQLESISCEKDEITNQLQKNKHSAEIERQKNKKLIEHVEDLRNEIKDLEERNARLQDAEGQRSAFLKQRDQHSLNKERMQKKNLSKENEALRKEIDRLEQHHAEEKKQQIDIETKLQHEVSTLKIQNRKADKKVTNAEKELEEMTSKCNEQQSIYNTERIQFERELNELRLQLDEMRKSTEYRWSRSAKKHIYEPEDDRFTDLNMLKRGTSSSQENYSSVGGRSDTEKENISLRNELTEAGKTIEKIRQEYSDLFEKYETRKIATQRTIESLQQEKDCLEQEKANFRAKLDQIQSDVNRCKNEQVHQQDSSHGTIENLLQQNSKLDEDRGLLRAKIFSVENEKIKCEDMFNKSKEDNKKLQREQDNLQDNLREKSNELKDSEVRLRKLEADIIFLQNTKTENDQLKESLREIEGVKREFENLEKRYQKETSDRMSADNISTKYKEDNDRLRKERNSARTELQRVLREKKESYQNLNTEQVLAKEELQSKEREKSELVALFKDKEDKDLQKIKLHEKEIETLKSRCRDYNEKVRQLEHDVKTLNSRYRDDQDKIQRLEHEIYTLKSSCTDENVQVQRMEHEIETSKSRHRDDNDKIQRMELEIETLKSKHRDDNNKMRQMEHEIETLKSRSTGEKANQSIAYEILQNKNDLETCKHQKKALEDERNELQKENIELENEIQSLNSKLEQIDDSEKNKSNLKKHIKDLEEGYRNAVSDVQTLTESTEDQKQENRDLIVKLENLDMEKKDLENKLRVMFSKDETSKLQKDNSELKHNLQNLSKQLKESENRLALNKSSLGNRCEELQNILQDKEQEINNLKLRFQELVDSKETSEVLQNRIINLQQEKSELNQRLQELEVLKRQVHKLGSENLELNKRLEISSKEKSSIHKENKELKNILQEKLSEVKRLEERCRHLQTLERDVQKLKRENKELDTEVVSQRQNNETLNNRLEILNVEKLEIEDRLRRRSPQVVSESKSCQNCFKHRNDISDLKREINDLRDRLSEAAGNKLRDNNPNIADLSDMNRPTSLAEKFSSLYTDEYTDAMEVIEDDMDEAASVKVMLDWLKKCYEWCQRLAKEQRDTLINRSIGFMENHGGQNVVLSDRCLIFVKEFQKKIAVESLAVVGQICHVKSVTQQTLSREKYIVKYIKKCSELCWMMQISDPPLYVNFDVNSGENLNKNDYNVFTKSGSKIDYLVWPVLYLHKTGPMLAKGVAQGK